MHLLLRGKVAFARHYLLLAAAALCVILAISFHMTARRHRSNSPKGTITMLPLPFMRPGAEVYRIDYFIGYDITSPDDSVMLRYNGQARRVVDLNQFRGVVEIRTPQEALTYVRLLTAPASEDTDLHKGYEVVNWAVAENSNDTVGGRCAFPQCGSVAQLSGTVGVISPKGYRTMGATSGLEGLLSPEAYRRGGFSAAVARAIDGGFEVTRWIYLSGLGKKHEAVVARTHEFVGADGSYRRVTIKASSPQQLTGAPWGVMVRA